MSLFSGEISYEEPKYTIINTPSRLNKIMGNKGGVEYIVRAHNTRVNTTLVSAGQMKRLINTNKIYVLMVVREKYSGTSYAFQGCDPSHKK